jgi:hypothetical protein
MSEVDRKRKEGDHILLNPEEWQEPEGRKVLGEYHKGEAEKATGVDADMERFEEHWRNRGCVNVGSEYHKPGAPYLEEKDRPEQVPEAEEEEPPSPHIHEPSEPRSDRPLNLATLEVITYALFRAVFGKGVHIPLRKEGLMDADVTIRGKDVIINTNELYAVVPELQVWQITYTHKGKPILQYGRDVPNGIKLHRLNALMLAVSVWRQQKRLERARRKLAANPPEGADGRGD